MRYLSDFIFKKGYTIESDETVTIPDFTPPGLTPQDESRMDGEFHEFGEFGAAEEPPQPDAPLQPEEPGEPDAEPPPPPEPEEPPLTREEIEQMNAAALEQVRRETAEQAYQEAYSKAYSDAVAEKRAQLEEAVSDVQEKLEELHAIHDDYIQRYTESLKYMAIEIAQKIMLHRIEEDDMSLRDLVMQTVSSMKHTQWISVDLSDRLKGLVEYLQEELSKPEYEGTVEVSPKECPIDTCRVNTPTGTVDASVSVQVENLKEAFENAELE